MIRRGTKPTEILLQTQKRSQKKSARILLMDKISHDAMRIAKKWTKPIRNWAPALNCFAIEFGERFPQ
ncbi:hypothetical protein ccbrp13_61450 [Ktedonobacteria bacterium brp13]|nr:hypothetical protein ccbrp13_61450 [Ktedonobacteria bacterium brp13]